MYGYEPDYDERSESEYERDVAESNESDMRVQREFGTALKAGDALVIALFPEHTPRPCEVCARPLGEHLWADFDERTNVVACSNQCSACGGVAEHAVWCDPTEAYDE